jgi:hypothetical protein
MPFGLLADLSAYAEPNRCLHVHSLFLNNIWAAKLKLEQVTEQEKAEEEIQAKMEQLQQQLEAQKKETAVKRGEAAEAMMAQHDEDWAGILDLKDHPIDKYIRLALVIT